MATDLSELIYASKDRISDYDCSKFKSRKIFDKDVYKKHVKCQFMAG